MENENHAHAELNQFNQFSSLLSFGLDPLTELGTGSLAVQSRMHEQRSLKRDQMCQFNRNNNE